MPNAIEYLTIAVLNLVILPTLIIRHKMVLLPVLLYLWSFFIIRADMGNEVFIINRVSISFMIIYIFIEIQRRVYADKIYMYPEKKLIFHNRKFRFPLTLAVILIFLSFYDSKIYYGSVHDEKIIMAVLCVIALCIEYKKEIINTYNGV